MGLTKKASSHSRFLRLVAEISSGLINATPGNIDNQINNILDKLTDLFLAERAFIFSISRDGSFMTNTHEGCRTEAQSFIEELHYMSLKKYWWWKREICVNPHIIINKLEEIPIEAKAERELFTKHKIKTTIAVPIRKEGRTTGFLGMESVRKAIVWNKEDVELLKILSNSITDTIIKTEAQKEVAQFSSMQKLLLNIADTYINLPTHQVNGYLTRSLKEIAELVGADRSYIFEYDLYDKVTHNTHEWCAEGIEPQIDHLQNVPLTEVHEWIEAHKSGNAFVVTDIAQLPYNGPSSLRGILEPQNIKSLITVPITDNKDLKGFVGFDSVKKKHLYSKNEQDLLVFFAQMIMSVKKRLYYEEMLDNARIHAENANKTKSEFLNNISSRIKNPVSTVLGFTNMLDNTSLNVSQKKFIKEANLSAKSILEVINQIVDFSKAENGKLEINESKTDLRKIASDALEYTKKEIADKKIELLYNAQPDIPRYCHTDGVRIRQVLVNLLDNAAKFTEKGEIELKLSCTKKNNDTAVYNFSVRDTGTGITAKDQKKILNTFNRFSTNYATQLGGTGLGLVISHHIIKKMGGILSFESKYGKGSRFFFSLNAKLYDTLEAYDPGKLKISRLLLVEDNGSNRHILEETLSKWNIDVVSCDNGIEAIKITKISEPFDVILINYRMPVINGIDTIRLIREDDSFLKSATQTIIMKSTTENSLIDDEARQVGSLYKISKPVKLSELYSTLYNISENKHHFK